MAPTSEKVFFASNIWDQIISNLGDERHLEPLSLVSKSLLSITNRHKQTLKLFDQTSHFLPSLLGRFPNLKHISFSEFTDDPVPVLHQMADSNFRLETLDLSNHEGLPIEGFEKLPASVLSGLKSLKMPSCSSYLDDNELEAIVKFFPNVEELDLSELSYGRRQRRRMVRYHRSSSSSRYGSITDNGIVRFGSSLKSLRKIDLSGRYYVEDKHVVSLSMNCHNLEEIVLKNCRRVSKSGVISVLRGCKKLKVIGLKDIDLASAFENRRIRSWSRNLAEIDFSRVVVPDELLKAMAKAKFLLTKVSLDRCMGFTYGDEFRLFFEMYHSLDHLALVEVEFLTDSTFRFLAKCLKKVRYVSLKGCQMLSDSAFFTLVKRCPLLETVEMENTNLGNQGFEESSIEVFKHQKIRTLNVMKNKNLRDGSLEKIATACPNLESLNLSNCTKISGKCVGRIMRSCCLIKHLRIHGCSSVRNLDLDKNTYKLEFLGATKSGLNDCGLTDIARKCPDLMFLELSGCKWATSKGVLEVVDKCTKLKEIDMLGCDNMNATMLPWMIAYRPSLRKIVPHKVCSKMDGDRFWRRGCYVESEDFYRHNEY